MHFMWGTNIIVQSLVITEHKLAGFIWYCNSINLNCHYDNCLVKKFQVPPGSSSLTVCSVICKMLLCYSDWQQCKAQHE